MVWGMIIGAVVGFGLALYRAPQSGEATRHQLTELGADLSARGRAVLEEQMRSRSNGHG